MTTKTMVKSEIIRLPTQLARAKFVRQEIRRQEITVEDLANKADLHHTTVARYAGLDVPGYEPTKDPRSNTMIRIFSALGFDVVFRTK